MNKYKTIKINENFGERYGNYLLFDRDIFEKLISSDKVFIRKKSNSLP